MEGSIKVLSGHPGFLILGGGEAPRIQSFNAAFVRVHPDGRLHVATANWTLHLVHFGPGFKSAESGVRGFDFTTR